MFKCHEKALMLLSWCAAFIMGLRALQIAQIANLETEF